MTVKAYFNWGRWVADCPDADCRNAEELNPPVGIMHCTFCDRVWPVVWPDDWKWIQDICERRPVPSTRNWYPGETVADLLDENAVHEVS
ncbi:MAG: hypothetical protein ACE5E8_02350 [Acidimicrobiia bacterium]